MKVIAKKNRELALINAQNTQNENRAETITLVVPEEYEDYNKKIVFITDDGNVWDVITNNEYKITNAITKYDKVDFYIWLTKEVDGESIDFRTKTKTLSFYHNVDASDEITDEEIHGVNTVVNLLEEEIEKVENLNIEATKIGSTTTVTITKKDGTTESVEINDGLDGYTPQKGIDYFTEQDIEEIEGDILNEVYTKSETDTLLEGKADIEDIPDVSSFITKDVNNLTNYTLKTNTGSLIDLEINDTTYVVTLKLKSQDGTVISTDTIDLPLESVVVSGRYDNTTKKVILTLENGSEVDFSIADLVAGLQTEITSQNKLASDLVDDSNSGNKFTTISEKATWNGKYTKPSGGIPKTDLASEVQTSLGKADTALQSSDLTNYVTNTDYASSSTAGVMKVSNANAVGVSSIGSLYPSVLSYLQYTAGGNWMFIGKGTLENVITGKGLINSSSDITGNASTSTTLKSFNYSRKGTNNTWAKVATASLVGTWEEKHAYLFVKGTHNSNFKQNGIISIDVLGNATKSKVNSYLAQFISASTDLNVENFYIEYQDGDANTNATINFWVKNTTNAYASWQFKILQNTGWTIESANTSVTTLPTQYFTGKNAELNNKTLKDKDGNDITTTYAKNTDYATSVTGGVVKTGYSINVDTNGNLYVESKSYSDYDSMGSNNAISKGTLENVITGRALENKYSMSEIKTGTWIDNKPVYRRVFTINLGAAPNIAQAHSLTDLDKFWINQSASFVFTSNESLPSTWYYSSTDWARTWMTSTTIRFRSPVDLTNRVLWVAVEYTKTTD